MNRTTTDLFQVQRDCEAMSASRITRELNKLEIAVANDGGETYTVVIGNRTHKGLAHVLAHLPLAHRLQMELEGEPNAH